MPNLADFTPANHTVSHPSSQLHHIFELADIHALWAAYAAGRPLLVQGDPGTGKSQMARAIARQLGWAYVYEVIRGSTELSDLHWHFDAIGRLGEAQVRGSVKDVASRLDPLKFLSPGAFWWAYNWFSAETRYQAVGSHLRPRPEYSGQQTPPGVVLLIDEIDKAEPDLPNGLLETLGHGQFTVPYLPSADNPIKADPAKVLVIITTNNERELPSAFVRRCFVHTLKMETDPQNRIAWLKQRGKLHFGGKIADPVYTRAAGMLWEDREGGNHRRYPPGLAEYLDLLRALSSLPSAEQDQRLTAIAGYALDKEAPEKAR